MYSSTTDVGKENSKTTFLKVTDLSEAFARLSSRLSCLLGATRDPFTYHCSGLGGKECLTGRRISLSEVALGIERVRGTIFIGIIYDESYVIIYFSF